MLYAKLTEAIEVVTQTGPFTNETKKAWHLLASVSNYDMGTKNVIVNAMYGNVLYIPGTGDLDYVDVLLTDRIKLTEEESANWGTDDSYILTLIAEKNNIQIAEILDSTVPVVVEEEAEPEA